MGNKIMMALATANDGFCVAEKRFGKWEQRTQIVPLIEKANQAFERMSKKDKYAVYKVISKKEIGTEV